MEKVLVSSCLIGKRCAYDGHSRSSERVKNIISDVPYIDICPEIEGNMGCPREKCEIIGGSGEDVLDNRARVLSSSGHDVTDSFIFGAEAALKTANEYGITLSIMKSKSPSCGKGQIYSGDFNNKLVDGNGVTTALLMRNGIRVLTEKDIM